MVKTGKHPPTRHGGDHPEWEKKNGKRERWDRAIGRKIEKREED
jgi:hypothetical protein